MDSFKDQLDRNQCKKNGQKRIFFSFKTSLEVEAKINTITLNRSGKTVTENVDTIQYASKKCVVEDELNMDIDLSNHVNEEW